MADIEKVIEDLKWTEQFLIQYEFSGHIQQVHDAIELLKEQAKRIETLEKVNAIKLNPEWHYVFNNYRKVVLCKDCKHYDYCYVRPMSGREWFCADGELR